MNIYILSAHCSFRKMCFPVLEPFLFALGSTADDIVAATSLLLPLGSFTSDALLCLCPCTVSIVAVRTVKSAFWLLHIVACWHLFPITVPVVLLDFVAHILLYESIDTWKFRNVQVYVSIEH